MGKACRVVSCHVSLYYGSGSSGLGCGFRFSSPLPLSWVLGLAPALLCVWRTSRKPRGQRQQEEEGEDTHGRAWEHCEVCRKQT